MVANLGLPQVDSHKLRRSRVHPGYNKENLQRAKDPYRAQPKDSGQPAALPRGDHAKRPKQGGQLSYARVAREGIRVAVVYEDYPESQLSKENFTDIQRAIGRLVDELPEEGFTPRLVDSYWAKGAAMP